MYHFLIKNKDLIRGISYLIVGILLALETFDIVRTIPVMKYLLLGMALYFIIRGLYFSRLSDFCMNHINTLLKK